MTYENHELWGQQIRIKVPDLIGLCEACAYEMAENNSEHCPNCDKIVHRECLVDCIACHADGCKACMTERSMMYFCCDDCVKAYLDDANLKVKHGSMTLREYMELREDLL